MIEPLDVAGFLTLGLLGGLGHCAGMCGPFVLLVARRHGAIGRPPLSAQLWYNAGRITTYAILGAIAGAAGRLLNLAGHLVGLRRGATIVAGAALLVWGASALASSWPADRFGGGFPGSFIGRLRDRAPHHPYGIGLLLGLLPCGLLYSAVIAAVAAGGAGRGALALAAFGVGTAPPLLGLSVADHLLLAGRPLIARVSPAIVLVMGAWFLWSGLLG